MNNSTYLMFAILAGVALLSTALVVAMHIHKASAQIVGYNVDDDDDGAVNAISSFDQRQEIGW
jgi:hypothetical protein